MKQLRKLQNDAVVEAPEDVSDDEPQTKAAWLRDGGFIVVVVFRVRVLVLGGFNANSCVIVLRKVLLKFLNMAASCRKLI